MKRKTISRLLASLPKEEKRITIPTIFTLLRIVLTPAIVVSMFLYAWDWAFILFLIAAVSDLLDGNIARLFNEKTVIGACLDPLADKILIISCFAALAVVQSPLFSIPIWFVIVVLVKELILVIGVFLLYLKKGIFEITPTILGKTTTVVQIGFIIWLFACYFFGWVPIKTYYFMLSLLLVLVAAVLVQYVRIGIKYFLDV